MNLSDKAGLIALSNALQKVDQLAMGILLVRILTQHDYGSYRQLWLVYSLSAPFFLLALQVSFYYFIPRLSSRERAVFVRQTYIILMGLGTLFAIVLTAFASPIARAFSNPSLITLLRIFGFYAALELPSTCFFALLVSLDRHRAAAFTNVTLHLGQLLSMIIPLVLGYDLKIALISLLIFAAGRLALVLMWSHRLTYAPWKGWNFSMIRSQFGYAVPLGCSRIVGMLSRMMDRLVISLVFTPATFAIYAIGSIEIPVATLLTFSVATVLRAELATLHQEGKTKQMLNLWHESIRKLSLAVMPICAFLLVTGDWFLRLLYTDQYAGAVPIFRVYLASLPLQMVSLGLIFTSTGLTKPLLRASFVSLGTNLVLNLLLVRMLGLIGPAIATVISLYAVVPYYLVNISRVLEAPLSKLLPWRTMAKSVAVSLVAAGATAPVRLLPMGLFPSLAMAGILYGGFYIILASKTALLETEDRMLIRRWATLRPVFRASP